MLIRIAWLAFIGSTKTQKNNRTAPTNCWLLAFAGSDKITWSSELFAFSATFRQQPWNNELPTRIAWLAFVGSIRKNQHTQELELSAYDATSKNNCRRLRLTGAIRQQNWTNESLMDCRSLGHTKSTKTIKVLNCLHMMWGSVTIADVCAKSRKPAPQVVTTNCRFESRDWRSLNQSD